MGSQVRALLFPPFWPPSFPGLPGAVVQLVRTPACHAGGRGFKSLPRRHPFFVLTVWSSRRRGRGKDTFASVAQLVEQRTENPRVVGSIPTGGTISPQASLAGRTNASVAHLVERHLAKVEVASSSLVTCSRQMSVEASGFCTPSGDIAKW